MGYTDDDSKDSIEYITCHSDSRYYTQASWLQCTQLFIIILIAVVIRVRVLWKKMTPFQVTVTMSCSDSGKTLS